MKLAARVDLNPVVVSMMFVVGLKKIFRPGVVADLAQVFLGGGAVGLLAPGDEEHVDFRADGGVVDRLHRHDGRRAPSATQASQVLGT